MTLYELVDGSAGVVISDHQSVGDAVKAALLSWHEDDSPELVLDVISLDESETPGIAARDTVHATLRGRASTTNPASDVRVTYPDGTANDYRVTYRMGPAGYLDTVIFPYAPDRLFNGEVQAIDATA